MDNDKLKAANDLDARIKAHEKTIQELVRLQKGSRIISVSRERFDSPVRIETSQSVYEIANIGEDRFADKLWDSLMSSVGALNDKLSDELNKLNVEFEKM